MNQPEGVTGRNHMKTTFDIARLAEVFEGLFYIVLAVLVAVGVSYLLDDEEKK
jgi:hypothetical protein